MVQARFFWGQRGFKRMVSAQHIKRCKNCHELVFDCGPERFKALPDKLPCRHCGAVCIVHPRKRIRQPQPKIPKTGPGTGPERQLAAADPVARKRV